MGFGMIREKVWDFIKNYGFTIELVILYLAFLGDRTTLQNQLTECYQKQADQFRLNYSWLNTNISAKFPSTVVSKDLNFTQPFWCNCTART